MRSLPRSRSANSPTFTTETAMTSTPARRGLWTAGILGHAWAHRRAALSSGSVRRPSLRETDCRETPAPGLGELAWSAGGQGPLCGASNARVIVTSRCPEVLPSGPSGHLLGWTLGEARCYLLAESRGRPTVARPTLLQRESSVTSRPNQAGGANRSAASLDGNRPQQTEDL